MMKKKNIFRMSAISPKVVSLALLFLHLGTPAIKPQEGSIVVTEKTKHFRQVIRRNGWRIPGEDAFTTVAQNELISVEGIDVYKKTYHSSSEPLVDLEGYHIENDTHLRISTTLCVVRNFFSYESNERIFAYKTLLVPVSVGIDSIRTYTGGMYVIYYYDEDGDGIFETRYSDLSALRVPSWIKKLKGKNTR